MNLPWTVVTRKIYSVLHFQSKHSLLIVLIMELALTLSTCYSCTVTFTIVQVIVTIIDGTECNVIVIESKVIAITIEYFDHTKIQFH